MALVLKPANRALFQAFGATVAAGFIANAASAQEVAPVKIEKIEVTGSSIKRSVNSEGALPVEILKVESLRNQGVTTVEEAIDRLSSNQNMLGTSQSVGGTNGGQVQADLRGIGSSKTLVLLNGRRIANFALDGSSVDLNAIPLAAIERIEVLKDGASAIYGTDAVGGVINFITKSHFKGISLDVGYNQPEGASGSGRNYNATISGGFGSLSENRFNIFGVFNYRKQDTLPAANRDYASTGFRPELAFKSSGTTFPANYSQTAIVGPDGKTVLAPGTSANPTNPGCNMPNSFLDSTYPTTCRYDYARAVDLFPKTEQYNGILRGSVLLDGGHILTGEYTYAENNLWSQMAPTPLAGLSMTNANPYFPGNGRYPAAATLRSNDPVSLGWRTESAGMRTEASSSISQRMLLELKGTIFDWDYNTGLSYNRSEVETSFVRGYLDYGKIQAGLDGAMLNGQQVYLNPFGAPTAAEQAYIDSAQITGTTKTAIGETTEWDFKASRDIYELAGGAVGLAFGGSLRHEKYSTDVHHDVTDQAYGSGLSNVMGVSGDRNVEAIFAEVIAPITNKLEARLAARYDYYEGVGGTFNPKIGVRYQPIRQMLIRGSANTGFRAPTLYETNQPGYQTLSGNTHDDPVLCPGGKPVAAANPNVSCGQQVLDRNSGSQTLKPEKSKAFSLGIVVEPVRNMTASLDYWNIRLKDRIGYFPEEAIMDNPQEYASRIVRCGQLTPEQIAASVDMRAQCSGAGPGNDPIAYLDTGYANLGGTNTQGFDVAFNYLLPAGDVGRFSFTFDGTYVAKYEYQRKEGGAWIEKVGRYSDNGPIMRWQHLAAIDWIYGAFTTSLVNRYKSGYEDQNSGFAPGSQYFNKVKPYSVLDVALTWIGIKGLTLTGGIKNITNEKPPFSNQNSTFQVGYDPRIADPFGRTYFARAAYKF